MLSIDSGERPAVPTRELTVTKGGAPVGYDAEGSRGDVERLRRRHDGRAGTDEQVWVAVQREWADDPRGQVKLAWFTPATGAWDFVAYPLDPVPAGAIVGVSEITTVDDDTLLVLERDNRQDPNWLPSGPSGSSSAAWLSRWPASPRGAAGGPCPRLEGHGLILLDLVGVAGFEPTAPRSQSECATTLRHTPVHRLVQSAAYATARMPASAHGSRPAEKLAAGRLGPLRRRGVCGRSSMAEPQPSKLAMRVRFPSPAPPTAAQVRGMTHWTWARPVEGRSCP